MKVVFRFVKNIFFLFLNNFVKLLPRDKTIWLYGGFADKFIDNAKYLFIEANETVKDVTHIWLSNSSDVEIFLKEKGYKCCQKKSIKGLYYTLRAKVHIYGSYPNDMASFAFSGGAFLFNLWHGVPLKKIEYDIKVGPLAKLYHPNGVMEQLEVFANNPVGFKKSDAILCPLEDFRYIFKEAFRVHLDNVCIAAYPRTMPFYWSEVRLMNHIEKFEPNELKPLVNKCKQFKQVWIYMPTWRDENPDFLQQAIPDLKILDEVCKKQNILFLLKLHINTKLPPFIDKWENIVIVPNFLDVYPLLPFTTTLLTDYSSVFFDYQLLQKNIVFYPFDLENYLTQSRGMYFEYQEVAKEDKVNSFKELIEYMEKDVVNHFFNLETTSLLRNEYSTANKITAFIKDKINFQKDLNE